MCDLQAALYRRPSAVTPSVAYDEGLAALAADVITTRFIQAAVAARSTRSVPFRTTINQPSDAATVVRIEFADGG